MDSTLIQVLNLLPDSTIDQPSTVASKQWRSAINVLISCTGWRSITWGRHHESPIYLTLITGFKTSTDAQTFLSTEYPTFLDFLQLLLASPPSPPSITAHLPPISHNTVTRISKLTFNNPSEGARQGIEWRFKWYTNRLKRVAYCETGSSYTGVKRIAKWAVANGETGEKGNILWVLANYTDHEAEARQEEMCFLEGDSKGKNIKETCLGFLRPLLQKEGAEELVWHVQFDSITQCTLERWNNSEDAVYS